MDAPKLVLLHVVEDRDELGREGDNDEVPPNGLLAPCDARRRRIGLGCVCVVVVVAGPVRFTAPGATITSSLLLLPGVTFSLGFFGFFGSALPFFSSAPRLPLSSFPSPLPVLDDRSSPPPPPEPPFVWGAAPELDATEPRRPGGMISDSDESTFRPPFTRSCVIISSSCFTINSSSSSFFRFASSSVQ